MKKSAWVASGLVLAALLSGTVAAAAITDDEINQNISELRSLPGVVADIKSPTIDDPQWLVDKRAAQAAAAQRQTPARQTNTSRSFTYSVQSWGAVNVSVGEFKSQAAATLADSRGWSRAGAQFREVPTGGDFVLVISEANELERRYSPGCSAQYSCRVGVYVIINQDRWLGATPSWNAANGSLRDYRHMVINHEIGHWLGHGHANCPAPGQLAPVMQQQSINLQGCGFNPWPLSSEVWIGR